MRGGRMCGKERWVWRKGVWRKEVCVKERAGGEEATTKE